MHALRCFCFCCHRPHITRVGDALPPSQLLQLMPSLGSAAAAAAAAHFFQSFLKGGPRVAFIPLHKIPIPTVNHDTRIHGLEVDLDHPLVSGPAGIAAAVPCPLPAGGATFHHCRTMHYSAPNTTNVPRRAYIMGASCPSRGDTFSLKHWQTQERSAYSIGTGGYELRPASKLCVYEDVVVCSQGLRFN